MTPDKLDLEIVTPERRVLTETVDEVILPGSEGYFGVLPGHAALLAALGVGELTYRIGDRKRYLVVSGGFAEVRSNRVTVLAETCERAEEVDLERATVAKQDAETQLIRPESSETEFRMAEVRLKKAVARIEVTRRLD
jgi:F-type H+-transporting ATPase subunit epsilon